MDSRPLHISTTRDEPGCGLRDVTARLTTDIDIVSCKRCRLSRAFRNRRIQRENAKKRSIARG